MCVYSHHQTRESDMAFIWQSNVNGIWYTVAKVNGFKRNIPAADKAAAEAMAAQINKAAA